MYLQTLSQAIEQAAGKRRHLLVLMLTKTSSREGRLPHPPDEAIAKHD